MVGHCSRNNPQEGQDKTPFQSFYFAAFSACIANPPCLAEDVTCCFSSPRRHQSVIRATLLTLPPNMCFLPLLLAQSTEMTAQKPSGSRWEWSLHPLIPVLTAKKKTKKEKEKNKELPRSPGLSLTCIASLLLNCSLRERKERGPKGS